MNQELNTDLLISKYFFVICNYFNSQAKNIEGIPYEPLSIRG